MMPRGDRKGPAGSGAMTGRALGYCVGNDQAGYKVNSVSPRAGRGRGFRNQFGCANRGLKRGYRNRANDFEVEKSQLNNLKNMVNDLASELENIKNKLNN